MPAPLGKTIRLETYKKNVYRCVTNIRYQETQLHELTMQLAGTTNLYRQSKLRKLIKNKHFTIARWRDKLKFENAREIEPEPRPTRVR
jgi:predicted fused transcriptional regulator/phosphomethylpyrimidine kinase